MSNIKEFIIARITQESDSCWQLYVTKEGMDGMTTRFISGESRIDRILEEIKRQLGKKTGGEL